MTDQSLFVEGVRATIQAVWREQRRPSTPVRDLGGEASPATLPDSLRVWVLDAAGHSVYLSLPLLACEAAGGDGGAAVPVAAAWHLFHAGAHLLDDVVDGAVPGLDRAQTLNATVALTFLAQLSLATLRQSRVPAERILDLITAFNATALAMSAGQASDLAWEDGAALDAYWSIAAAKSGAFFALACRAGAMLGVEPEAETVCYERFGAHFGMLLQVSDDLRAVWRPRGRGDLLTLGRTLPIVYARAMAPPETEARLRDLVPRVPDDAVALAEVQELLKDPKLLGEHALSVLHYVTVRAGIHYQKARAALRATSRRDVAQIGLLLLLDRVMPALAIHDGAGAAREATDGA